MFIQSDSWMRTNTRVGIYHINQSQPNITSHIQSYRDGGVASSHVTFPHSFLITPHQTHAILWGDLSFFGYTS